MKKYALPLALMGVFALQGCEANKSETATATDEGSTAAPAGEVALDTSERRLSYGIAYGLGQRMLADGVPLDSAAFAVGLEDSLAGTEAKLTQEEIATEMQAYQAAATAKSQKAQSAQGEANLATSATFLAENAKKDGVKITESGLQYEIIEAGKGAKPVANDTVEVHYRGTLVDGTEFDSSYNRGETVKFGVTQVIPGWTEALQMMQVGSKWKLAIPSDLAYGPGGAGGGLIGPNAALIFDVELVGIPSQETADKPK